MLIPVLDEERHLLAAVERMRAQVFTGDVELLFIDGGSTDASPGMLARLAAEDPRIRVLQNPKRRTPSALNIGLAAARGEYVARMDAHSHYPPTYLAEGVERLRRGGAVSVSGPQIAVGDAPFSRRVALALQTPLGVGGAKFRSSDDAEFEVDTGFTGVWRRELLQDAGGWDEAWVIDQDCELAFRLAARDEGGHICVPAMAAEYIPRNSVKRLARQYWWYGVYKVKTINRHPQAMRPSHVLPPGLALTALAAIAPVSLLRRPARAGLALYCAVLGAAAARAAREAEPADAGSLPLVFATMHLSYGFGFLDGCRRFGVPAAAVAAVVRRLAAR